jgi:hypothetical protein
VIQLKFELRGKAMRKLNLLLASTALLAFQAPVANATTATFDWTFTNESSSTVEGSGTITVTSEGVLSDTAASATGGGYSGPYSFSAYEVTAITGTIGGVAINGTEMQTPPGTPCNDTACIDNRIYIVPSGDGALDLSGIGFYTNSANTNAVSIDCDNLYSCFAYASNGSSTFTTIGGSDEEYLVTLTTATPLPAALPLLGTGLGLMGLLGWRRKRKNDVAIAAA